MKIAILGGTGDVGQGLALRFCFDTNHEVVIGSREADRARRMAEEYETELGSRGLERTVTGRRNEAAVTDADVVILAIPPDHVVDVLDTIGSHLQAEAIVVTPVVRMTRREGGFSNDPPAAGSMAAVVAESVPDSNPVVGAFHTLSADRLANLDLTFDLDTLVFGDDDDAKDIVAGLANEIEGLRALDAGPLASAPEVEALTPLVVTLAMHGAGHDIGVKFG